MRDLLKLIAIGWCWLRGVGAADLTLRTHRRGESVILCFASLGPMAEIGSPGSRDTAAVAELQSWTPPISLQASEERRQTRFAIGRECQKFRVQFHTTHSSEAPETDSSAEAR